MTKLDEKVADAKAAIDQSLRQQHATGQSPVEQAVNTAASLGEEIVGDPPTMQPHELPPHWRPESVSLSMQDLLTWGIPEQTIIKYAQQGVLGQEYMHWSVSDLRER